MISPLAQKLIPKLIEVASKESWITYEQVAEFLDIDLGNPDDRWQLLGKIMGDVNDETIKEGYLLTSVIIHKKSFIEQTGPGKGYFALARNVGLLVGKEDERAFWRKQLILCYRKYKVK